MRWESGLSGWKRSNRDLLRDRFEKRDGNEMDGRRLNSKKKTIGVGIINMLPLVAGGVVAALALSLLFSRQSTDFANLALAEENTSLYASNDGYPIHCKGIEDAPACIEGHEARGKKPLVLWFGNSQLHAINQFEPGQENAPPLLFRRFLETGLDLLTFSQPNANLQEHLVLFQYLRTRLPLNAFILPLVFDDMRETGLRTDIAMALDDAKTTRLMEQREIGRKILAQAQSTGTTVDAIMSDKSDFKALKDTTQEKTEQALNHWLDEHCVHWAVRAEARGTLLWRLFYLRNRLLGITAQTARPLIPGRREQNMMALEEILRVAKREGIRVFTYIVPIRNDVTIPYVPDEYAEFKAEADELARRYGAVFANLENLVPAGYWGTKDATDTGSGQELDFMHFQATGHQMLANALDDLVLGREEGCL